MEFWQRSIEAGNQAVFMIDECNLLWENLLGYGWAKTDKRISILMKNDLERQT